MLDISIAGRRDAFRPDETLAGTVSWSFPDPPRKVEVFLLWRTSGKGDADEAAVASVELPVAGASGYGEFAFPLPDGPYSFSGRLITLSWRVEAVTKGPSETAASPFTLSPSGGEIRLRRVRETADEDEDQEDGSAFRNG